MNEAAAGRRGVLRWVLIAVAAVVLVVAVVAGVLLTNGSADEKASSGSTASPSAPPLQVHTKVTRVAGQLPTPQRRAVERNIAALVKDYLEAAFVEGRSGISAFPGFTPAARTLAARDATVLTAHSTGTQVKRAAAYISVFADHHRAQGATVRLVLALVTGEGTLARPMVGRLLLTPTASGWRVFGYDVARGAGR